MYCMRLILEKALTLYGERFAQLLPCAILIGSIGAYADSLFMKTTSEIVTSSIEGSWTWDLSIQSVFYSSLSSLLFLHIILGVVACASYLHVLEGDRPGIALKKASGDMIPLLGCFLWCAIRSFVWIPVIGFFSGIALLPRLILAPLIHLHGKTTITVSAQQSIYQTTGKWLQITALLLIFFVCTVTLLWAVQTMLQIVLSSYPGSWHWIRMIAWQLIVAYGWSMLLTLQRS